jgi:hypothetical protein
MNNIQEKLIKAGVKNLREFGYTEHCNESTILTDIVYSNMFANMLHENKGNGIAIDEAIEGLLNIIKINNHDKEQ